MISGKSLWNYFARPHAVAPKFWRRVHRSIDAFASSGKPDLKRKREPNPVYSEVYFAIGPDSLPVAG